MARFLNENAKGSWCRSKSKSRRLNLKEEKQSHRKAEHAKQKQKADKRRKANSDIKRSCEKNRQAKKPGEAWIGKKKEM